jgi:hypothetical protein
MNFVLCKFYEANITLYTQIRAGCRPHKAVCPHFAVRGSRMPPLPGRKSTGRRLYTACLRACRQNEVPCCENKACRFSKKAGCSSSVRKEFFF